MTLHGTNTYILGGDALAVIDPGPQNADHLAAVLAAIDSRPVSHILVTHSHLDHSPLATELSQAVSAPVCAMGNHLVGRRPVMEELARKGLVGGGEGVDAGFAPDQILQDGAVLSTGCGPVEVLHLPGHMANHLGFVWRDRLFCGDHVMGWASSLVSPPDGDLTAFMAACHRLLKRPERIYHPGHGAPIPDGPARVRWLIEHRESRTNQLRQTLAAGPAGLQTLTERVYTDIDPAMLPAAARNLLAHLIALVETGEVTARPDLSKDAEFALTEAPAAR